MIWFCWRICDLSCCCQFLNQVWRWDRRKLSLRQKVMQRNSQLMRRREMYRKRVPATRKNAIFQKYRVIWIFVLYFVTEQQYLTTMEIHLVYFSWGTSPHISFSCPVANKVLTLIQSVWCGTLGTFCNWAWVLHNCLFIRKLILYFHCLAACWLGWASVSLTLSYVFSLKSGFKFSEWQVICSDKKFTFNYLLIIGRGNPNKEYPV